MSITLGGKGVESETGGHEGVFGFNSENNGRAIPYADANVPLEAGHKKCSACGMILRSTDIFENHACMPQGFVL